jgi:hypothetical protein
MRSSGSFGGTRSMPTRTSASGGGFSFPNDGSWSHTNTGPGGTTRNTNITNTGGSYNRNTTSTNGDYNRTVNSSANNGQYNRNTNTNTAYGSHSSNTNANANTGNYNRTASGSNGYGSYNSSASGNAYNGSYNRTTTGSNVYGQTYYGHTYTSGGNVYHGSAVVNPVYAGYPAWGWNYGYAWYPAPYYWGGGFWGAWAVGAATAITYGEIVEDNQTTTSYEVSENTPGSKLLASYKLTQTKCGPPNLVVIWGPNNSVICAHPNSEVKAGNYGVDSATLQLVPEQKQ